jgi:hypothetical protein
MQFKTDLKDCSEQKIIVLFYFSLISLFFVIAANYGLSEA